MSSPSDDLPTTVIPQQTAEQPAVTTAPATRRSRIWPSKLPARIGRARTSTVVIGALFVLLGGLNLVLPVDEGATTTVTAPDGRQVEVPCEYVSCDTTTPTTPSTPTAPASTGPATPTSRAPQTTAEDDEEPATTTPRSSSPSPTSTPSRTTSAPGTTAEETTSDEGEEEQQDEEPTGETSSPTG